MKNRILRVALTLMVAGLMAFTVNAQPRNNGTGRGMGHGKGKLCQIIPGLTQDQQTKITEMQKNFWNQMDQLRLKRMRAATLKERDEIGIQMAEARASHHADIMALLNKDQQQWMNDHVGLRMGRGMGSPRGCGMGYGHGHGPGRGGR